MPKEPMVVVMLMLRILEVVQGSQRGRSAPACDTAGSLVSRAGTVTCMRLSGITCKERPMPVVRSSVTVLSIARLRDALSILMPDHSTLCKLQAFVTAVPALFLVSGS